MRKHDRKANRMTKFYFILAACMVFAPVAIVVFDTAAQIVA